MTSVTNHPTEWVALGVRVRDAKGKVGIVHGIGDPVRFSDDSSSSCVWLLPPGGGFEWRAALGEIARDEEEAVTDGRASS